MNREIKFRAWCQEHPEAIGEMVDWETVRGNFGWYDDTDTVLMQYTGLKDKNGKEIYEGDIITWPHDSDGEREIEAGISWVKYNTNYCRFDLGWPSEFGKEFQGTMEFLSRIVPTIIGNIYENPELIKENDRL